MQRKAIDQRGVSIPVKASLIRVSGLWTVLAILLALVVALCQVEGLRTYFAFWDDEGYMLVSLTHYVNEGHLYTQTFSQYGPFYFYAQGIFFQLLHLPVTHDTGRLVMLVYWVASSLLAAVFVYRSSESTFLACAAGLCSMLAGLVLTNEPGHPEQVVLLLYMAAAYLSLPPFSGRNHIRLFLLGCVGAALVFTKVNLGVFYIAGLAQALVCLLPSGTIRTAGIVVTMIYASAVPSLLMHSTFNEPAFRDYCLLATAAGILTFACGALLRPAHPLPMRAALYSGAGLLAGTVLIVAATSVQGMPLGALIWGVILNPVHQPQLLTAPLYITRANFWTALVLTAGVVCLRSWGCRLAKTPWLDVLKCAVGLGSILVLPLGLQIQWVVPLLPLTLIPGSHWERDGNALFPRLFVTCMAVTQFLGPYPVAGSQRGIAAAPMILWAFLCVNDGIAGLRASSFGRFRFFADRLRLDAVMGAAILLIFARQTQGQTRHVLGMAFSPVSQDSRASTVLKGAAWLRLPREQTAMFESIARDVGANCSILFTMPGMGSFNMWSGVPTPNGWNLSPWMKGISLERQSEILRIMQADARSCAILNRNIARFWDGDVARVAALPLASYIMTDMPKVSQFGAFEIRVHPQRSSPWSPSP